MESASHSLDELHCTVVMAISKTQRKQLQATADAFNAHFSKAYGAERWEHLRARLVEPTEHAALINAYVPSAEIDRALLADAPEPNMYELLRLPPVPTSASSAKNQVPTRLLCLKRRTDHSQAYHSGRPFPPPRPAAASDPQQRLYTHWNLDGASVLAAQCLDVQPGHAVLDLCAAPGGKSITLAQKLWPELYADHPSRTSTTHASILHSNEVDPARLRRLHANLKSYLPNTLMDQGLVEISRIDATSPRAVQLFPLGEEGYDRILLDAPCSSERHILHAYMRAQQSGTAAPEMLAWKPTMSRSMSKTQLALLRTAWAALRPGGRLVYATCSLSEQENDHVVRAFLTSTPEAHVLRTDSLVHFCQQTEYGYFALPDYMIPGTERRSPWGPLYFCMLEKP